MRAFLLSVTLLLAACSAERRPTEFNILREGEANSYDPRSEERMRVQEAFQKHYIKKMADEGVSREDAEMQLINYESIYAQKCLFSPVICPGLR